MVTFKSFDPDELSIPARQAILSSAVAPRPIAFASTIDSKGNVNLSPFSFFNVFSNNPPILIFSPSRRGRDNTTKHTYENIKEVPEVVICMVNYPMVEQMSLASTEYDKGVNEFTKAGFTEVASEIVKPPRVGESPVSFECTVDEVKELGDQGGAGNLVICRVKRIHINSVFFDDADYLDTTRLQLVARMGGNWYSKAFGDALFEIPKPLRTLGIGIDQLPESVRNSTTLSANNLGRLGNAEQLPSEVEVKALLEEQEFNDLFDQYSGEELNHKVHEVAKTVLESGDINRALAILFTLEYE